MKALVVELAFFEAFFKVHYTKGFRLTYPIPLPTTVAGIFGALLGIERKKLAEEFSRMLFGAKIVHYNRIMGENVTYLQYKSGGAKIERGVAPLFVVNEPTYLVAIAGEERKINEFNEKIKGSINYLPYGGQNDFFIKDWAIRGVRDITESDEISNYAPQDLIANPILEKNSEIQILPVMHKISKNPNFYFIINGTLKLKENIPCVKEEKIGLYKLEQFQFQNVRW